MSLPADSEQWRPVVGYEGYYEVSDRGRVRGVDRVIWRTGRWTRIRGQVLTQFQNEKGRPWVSLYIAGRSKRVKVHIVVARAFLGPRPDGLVTCHADDDPTNNCLSNLRYGTLSDNQHDAVRNGGHYLANKTHCKRDHPLEIPNLVPSLLPVRSCRACARAYKRVRYAREIKAIDLDFKTVADEQYARIMKE